MADLLQQFKDFMNYEILSTKNLDLHVYSFVGILVIFLAVKLILYMLRMFFERRIKAGDIDSRKAYAIRQIVSYLIYTIGIVLMLDSLGVQITVLIAGSTALFVGLGLGLQDTFKDLVAGVVILIERTVSSGDIVEINHVVGKVIDVGLRTTRVITRDDIIILVPNQKLIADHVINWTQNDTPTRFNVEVSVAYGSDTRLVERLLLEAAKSHPETIKKDKSLVHFTDFGDNGLHFRLFFHCGEMFRIERIKSEIRFEIDKVFRENNITIPFPQRVVHMMKNDSES